MSIKIKHTQKKKYIIHSSDVTTVWCLSMQSEYSFSDLLNITFNSANTHSVKKERNEHEYYNIQYKLSK